MSGLQEEMVSQDRRLAEKDALISTQKKELTQDQGGNANACHRVSSMNQDKLQDISKMGIDKNIIPRRGLNDDMDDFNGTHVSLSPQCGSGKSEDAETITLPATIKFSC